MKSTRERILHTLLAHPQSTISYLAEAVNINAISVRHHLTTLQADGLVNAEEERHGVGRPRLVYTLSEKGIERFPTRYMQLTNRLLDQLKASMPEATVDHLFSQMAASISENYTDLVKSYNIEQKLDLVGELLGREGFTLNWEKEGDHYRLNEISCPYFQVGKSHPEVCTVDQNVISTLLAVPAEKVSCILRGDNHCSYLISAGENAVA